MLRGRSTNQFSKISGQEYIAYFLPYVHAHNDITFDARYSLVDKNERYVHFIRLISYKI